MKIGDIVSTRLIGNSDPIKFNTTVAAEIAKFQEVGYTVEIQFSVTPDTDTSKIAFHAYIIAREPVWE